ncbi:MAG: Transposase IS4 family protein [uncultured bacterium]|nr:MAG: Transposase IS4 family protein [uncultured bacterium]
MQLPKFIDIYLRALLSAPWRFTLIYLSLVSKKSHDYLNRGLRKKYSFKDLLKLLLSGKALNDGYIVIDETDVDKSFAKKMTGAGWIYSNRKKKHIFGYHIVTAVWTNGVITIPLGWKIYKKGGEETKLDLALKLIKYCLYSLNINPKAFLFDSFYASEEVLKYLISSRQNFISQVHKNRKLSSSEVRAIEKGRPYWTKVGNLTGGINVQAVKNRKKYFVTNMVGIKREEQLAIYKVRWNIEEVFRFSKKELGFEKCQSVSLHAQNTHFGTCFLLYGLLQDIAERTQMTVYQIKLEATLDVNYAERLNIMDYFTPA